MSSESPSPAGRLFGNDGVRALANVVLTPELMMQLGRALGVTLAASTGGRRQVVVGRDPRPSSELLEAAFLAGLASVGVDSITTGIITTAGVAFLTPYLKADAGAVITASHNPLEDNGLKLFDREGYKYSDADEIKLERLLSDENALRPPLSGRAVGRIRDRSSLAQEVYVEHLVAGIPDLDGIRLTVDCANGAAATTAPWAYRLAGADVVEIASDRSGNKINSGVGATNPEFLRKSLTNGISDLGVAHDGDADRLIAVDELGHLVNGADLLAIFAVDAHQHGRLPGNALVTTSMTNRGLATSLGLKGISVFESDIGDRPVLRMMRKHGYQLGGEQTGHVIMLNHATTGDGILSALTLLKIMSQTGNRLHDLAKVWRPCPQRLVNIPVLSRSILERAPDLSRLIKREQETLKRDGGRLIVRLSTIENVVRIMCEAVDQTTADTVAERIAGQLRELVAREVQEVK